MTIAIAGTDCVGLSNGGLMAQYNKVVCLDVTPEKAAMRNRKESPIKDAETEDFLMLRSLSFRATLDKQGAYVGSDYVIIANRNTEVLADMADKAYIRDLFGSDL